MVPDIFLDVDLLIALANSYESLSRKIIKSDDLTLVTLDKNSFMINLQA